MPKPVTFKPVDKSTSYPLTSYRQTLLPNIRPFLPAEATPVQAFALTRDKRMAFSFVHGLQRPIGITIRAAKNVARGSCTLSARMATGPLDVETSAPPDFVFLFRLDKAPGTTAFAFLPFRKTNAEHLLADLFPPNAYELPEFLCQTMERCHVMMFDFPRDGEKPKSTHEHFTTGEQLTAYWQNQRRLFA